MGPDYFLRLLAVNHPALANYGRIGSAWAPQTTSVHPSCMGQPFETHEQRRERLQHLTDDAARRAEEKFECFRTLCGVVNDAYGRAVSRRNLEQALEHLKMADGR
jgi:hypothetical protein